MPAFRCTNKLLNQLGEKSPRELEPHIDDWHANLIWVERKKLLFFCSSSTLFCCVTPPVLKSEIQSLNTIFLSALESAMRFGQFSEHNIDHCLSKYESMAIAKTNNLSVLGSMTDYLYHLKCWVEEFGGLASCDVASVAQSLNKIPQVQREFFNALEAFHRSLIRGVD